MRDRLVEQMEEKARRDREIESRESDDVGGEDE